MNLNLLFVRSFVLNAIPDCALSFSHQGSIGLPDVHSGYGFAVGNVAAFDMGDPDAVVSPGEETKKKCAGRLPRFPGLRGVC